MDIKRIHILLIEDNPDDIVLLKEILAQENGTAPKFKFDYAHRLKDGLDCLKRGGIDIVVLDLTLPDSQGMDTLVKVQSQTISVPVVVLTDLNDEVRALEAVSKGAQDYVFKSHLSSYVFVRTILHAIERHKIKAELDTVTSKLLATNIRLEQLAFLDPLTELLNRRGLQEAIFREFQLAKRDESDLIGVIFDLDDFKKVNDALGHAVGDVILKEIARKIKASLRVTDYVARIGGDEFLILMPQTKTAEGIQVAQKLRLLISESTLSLPLKDDFKITASFGLLPVTEEVVSIDELIAKAHLSLLQSKERGKNRISYGISEKKESVPEEGTHTLADVLEAIRKVERYIVLKQPIFNLVNGQKVGYEFLSRLNVKGFEMPDDFFRLCLENNILTIVDYQCLKNCIIAGAALPPEMQRHVNLFPSTIIDISEQILRVFPRDLPVGTYCIEISEQQIIGDPAYLSAPIHEFKKIGIHIAIDDVGFGRSCLESLIVLEPDIIKIDKRWVNGIFTNPWCVKSLKRLLKVAEALGAKVVAEGIENQGDLDLLKELGVKYGQGYLLGRPS